MTTPHPPEVLSDVIEYALNITRRLETRRFEDRTIIELTPLEQLVTHYIKRFPGASLHDVADGVNLQLSNASAAVKRLVDVGLVQRERDVTDRRRIALSLTSKASENLERVREEWRRAVSGADIDSDDLDAAFRVLGAIDSWIGRGASNSQSRSGLPEAPTH